MTFRYLSLTIFNKGAIVGAVLIEASNKDSRNMVLGARFAPDVETNPDCSIVFDTISSYEGDYAKALKHHFDIFSIYPFLKAPTSTSQVTAEGF